MLDIYLKIYLGTIQRSNTCMFPVSTDDRCIVGYSHVKNILYCIGGGCWGITMSLGMSQIICELFVKGDVSCVSKETMDIINPQRTFTKFTQTQAHMCDGQILFDAKRFDHDGATFSKLRKNM